MPLHLINKNERVQFIYNINGIFLLNTILKSYNESEVAPCTISLHMVTACSKTKPKINFLDQNYAVYRLFPV